VGKAAWQRRDVTQEKARHAREVKTVLNFRVLQDFVQSGGAFARDPGENYSAPRVASDSNDYA
jgi:hypothetical protein